MTRDKDSSLTMELINLCVEYLKKLFTRQITLLEFQKEVAYIAIQDKYGFTELRPKPFPTPIPEALQEYYRLSKPERMKIPDKFWKSHEISQYIKEKDKISIINKSNYHWLYELKGILSFDDVAVQKIQSKIYAFEEANHI